MNFSKVATAEAFSSICENEINEHKIPIFEMKFSSNDPPTANPRKPTTKQTSGQFFLIKKLLYD